MTRLVYVDGDNLVVATDDPPWDSAGRVVLVFAGLKRAPALYAEGGPSPEKLRDFLMDAAAEYYGPLVSRIEDAAVLLNRWLAGE